VGSLSIQNNYYEFYPDDSMLLPLCMNDAIEKVNTQLRTEVTGVNTIILNKKLVLKY